MRARGTIKADSAYKGLDQEVLSQEMWYIALVRKMRALSDEEDHLVEVGEVHASDDLRYGQ